MCSNFKRLINIQEIRINRGFHEIVRFLVLHMCSKPMFCSKIAQKDKTCSWFLEPQKVAQKLPSTIGTGQLGSVNFCEDISTNISSAPIYNRHFPRFPRGPLWRGSIVLITHQMSSTRRISIFSISPIGVAVNELLITDF